MNKSNIKNIIFSLFLITGLMLIGTGNVDAASDVRHGYSGNLYESCVNDNSCMLLCGYTNKVRYTSTLVDAKYNYFSAYIYYFFKDNNLKVTWYSQETDLNLARHAQLLNNKTVFFEGKDDLVGKGVCPTNAYIDIDGFGLESEVCFDNNGTYCLSDPGKGGTKFSGESTREYNYANQIEIYFNNHAPSITDCNQLRGQNLNVKDTLETDFSTNFLHGNAIPSFMSNLSNYTAGMDSLKQKYTNLKNECDAEVNNSNELSAQEKENLLRENQQGLDSANNQIDEATRTIETGRGPSQPDTTIKPWEQGCGMFGNASDPKSMISIIQEIFNYFKFGAPILVIVLGMLDFTKAIMNNDADGLKKAGTNFIKRLIAAVILFLLPIILSFILSWFNEITWDPLCGIK